MRRKKGTEETPPAGDVRITPEEVQQVEFRLAFRGYNERDVDAFLDRITEGLTSYLGEIDRLRAGGGQVQAASGSGAEAQEIVARARQEADEIVRRAHDQAAGIRAAAGVGAGDARGAVAPFLNREREFLQSLGGLVQTHAEEIKQMVMAIRERSTMSPTGGPVLVTTAAVPAEGPARGGPVASEASAPATEEPSATAMPPEASAPATEDPSATAMPPEAFEAASAAEIRERLQASGPQPEVALPEEDASEPEVSPPVVIESATEPVFSTEGAPASERRERSLRELFWGED
ncbi:MAG: DivIVA domain-containing protein [Actinomycetota bacterium]